MSDLYENDIVLWSEHQAELLRRVGAGEQINDQVEWGNVVEEIEALARSERSTLASHINTVIEHLARLEASPALDARNGWIETILRTRQNIETVLRTSPSLRRTGLRRTVGETIAAEHPRAIRLVGRLLATYGETPLVPLDRLQYDADQVLGDWLPAADTEP